MSSETPSLARALGAFPPTAHRSPFWWFRRTRSWRSPATACARSRPIFRDRVAEEELRKFRFGFGFSQQRHEKAPAGKSPPEPPSSRFEQPRQQWPHIREVGRQGAADDTLAEEELRNIQISGKHRACLRRRHRTSEQSD